MENKLGELRLRNVDAAALAKLSQIAQKNHLSRNEYIKRLIENMAFNAEFEQLELKYDQLVTSTLNAVKEMSSEIKRLNDLIERILNFNE